ncbi:MAG TPA: hypothetical protein VFV47_07980 [Hyphomicrobiaceae bacterium]|nr:hypothetical protein [Hyphomicrobiaceae bacterium]
MPACAGSEPAIKVGELGESDTPIFLVLSDQLQRVRNVREREAGAATARRPEARVCVAFLPDGAYGGVAPVPGHIVNRLQQEQSGADITFDIVSSYECLAHYTRDDGPFTAEPSDVLIYAGAAEGQCGNWIGGSSGRETIQYELEIEGGIARLSGGERCVRQYWIRT